METNNIIVNIGNNNTNYATNNNQDAILSNSAETLLLENVFLKQENEKLKGLLNIAVIQLRIKDKLIKIFNKKWIGL